VVFVSATILLKNVRVASVIGVYDHEKSAPQELKLDLELSLRSAGASLSDELRDTVDYDVLIKAIRQFGAAHQHELLERFTYALAQHLLAGFPLKHVQITAWKKIAVHAPTDIAVRVNMAAGESWQLDERALEHARDDAEDRYND
jgi:7,8-dihydroneopterin aldolase/epimerase/oxygenase